MSKKPAYLFSSLLWLFLCFSNIPASAYERPLNPSDLDDPYSASPSIKFYIPISDDYTVYNSSPESHGHLYGWAISADTDLEVKKADSIIYNEKPKGGVITLNANEDYVIKDIPSVRSFDITLAYGTPPDASFDIVVDRSSNNDSTVAVTPNEVIIATNAIGRRKINDINNLIIANGNKIRVSLDADAETTQFDIYVYVLPGIGAVDPTAIQKHEFYFTIAGPDTGGKPSSSEVESIEITTPPQKTDTYFEGEKFRPYGMVVTATLKEEYMDTYGGKTVTIEEYDVTPQFGGYGGEADRLTLNDTYVTISFGNENPPLTAKQPITVNPVASISDVTISNGQMFGEWVHISNTITATKKTDKFDAVVLYGQSEGDFRFHTSVAAEVKVGEIEQSPSGEDDGLYNVKLPASKEGTSTTVTVSVEGSPPKTYTFTCYEQAYSGMPSEIVEYLCMASQYTNGAFILGRYGLNYVSTLRGAILDADDDKDPGEEGGMTAGPASMGNFGGYIVYRYDEPIIDDPKNPYGVDFIVYGNSHAPNQGFTEPGNVLVSENNEDWYALAGSAHYEDYAKWNHNVTYTNENGAASPTRFGYPKKEYYPLFPWTSELEQSMTLTGVLLDDSGTDAYGSTAAAFPDFGYADIGERGTSDEAGNPYTGPVFSKNDYIHTSTDGFDLKWAVDAEGKPVDMSGKQIRYIKVQTANFVDAGSIGEKSTEVNGVRVARPSDSPVGVTEDPVSIEVNGTDVLEVGTYVRNVTLPSMFTVTVTPKNDTASTNIYINGVRGASRTFGKMPDHKMLRIIVQEEQKEPVIYYMNLTEGGGVSTGTTVKLDADGGLFVINSEMLENAESWYTPYTPSGDRVFPTPEKSGASFLGWFGVLDGKEYAAYTDDMPSTLELKAKWKYDEKTVRLDADGGWLTVDGQSRQSVELKYSVETPANERAFPTPTKEGFTFLGWYDADDEKYTEFEDGMPSWFELKAKWQKNSGGVPGTGSEVEHAVVIDVTDTLAVTEAHVQEAVTRAAEAGGTAKPTIVINATGSKAVKIPEETIAILTGAATPDNIDVPIVLEDGEVTLNKAAVQKLAEAAASSEAQGDIKIVITPDIDKAGGEALTEAQKDAIENDEEVRLVYDVSCKIGDTELEITDLPEEYRLLIGLKYTLGNDEDPLGVLVKYFDKDGRSYPMMEGKQYASGRAWFKTSHLSVYAVTYDPSLVTDGGDYHDGGCGAGGFVMAGIGTLLALAVVAARKRRAA
jgi:uncharacterized repeat protein (TIGR02543 family)